MNDYQQPEIKAEDADEFSDYGGSIASETQSLSESIFEFLEKNGRRYHTYFGEDKNPMPTDAREQERLDVASEMMLLSSGSLHQAPLPPDRLHNVLDLGTGTGHWAVDFAQEYPQAEVLGIDICPLQPSWVPPNCRFELDDFELDWNYHRTFDFIYARTISQSVSNWPRLLQQAKRYLNPGGYIELGEALLKPKSDDSSMPADWPPAIVFGRVSEALEKLGRAVPTGPEFRQLLQAAGFTDITVKNFKIPFGIWPKAQNLKECGALSAVTVKSVYESYALHLCTTVLGMTSEEAVALCKKAEAAHNKPSARRIHMYFDYVVVYGRKPEEGN